MELKYSDMLFLLKLPSEKLLSVIRPEPPILFHKSKGNYLQALYDCA